MSVDYIVSNFGSESAAAFEVYLWANRSTPPTVADAPDLIFPVSFIAPGASVFDFQYITSSITGGTAYAVVDPLNIIAEADETNNIKDIAVKSGYSEETLKNHFTALQRLDLIKSV